MDSVLFEPKIATDLRVDWRRQTPSQGSDMFGDLLADQLKRRAEADQQDLDLRRRERPAPTRQASDPVSGRPARVVLANTKTIRGEAKEVDDGAERRLPDQSEQTPDESCAKADGEQAKGDKSTASDKPAVSDAAPSADQAAQPADDKKQPADPTATVIVAVQQADQKPAGCAPEIANATLDLAVPAAAEGAIVPPAPEPAGEAKTPATANTAAAGGTPEQPAVAAVAEAGLSAVLANLDTGGSANSNATNSPTPASQALGTVVAAAADKQPLLQITPAQLPIADVAAAPAQPQAERPATEIKARPGSTAHPTAIAPDPSPSQAPAPQSAQPQHIAALGQPSAAAESGGGDGDMLDQSLSGDGSGPGWTFHLAQGAAGKRADFVAQLKQHLQNLPAHEQVAVHVQRALREGTGKISIQLSPAELGRVEVKLEIDEDKRVTAAVTVERASTLELLQRDARNLERALHDAGLKMDGGALSFSLGQSSDQDFAQDLGQPGTASSNGTALDAKAESDQPDATAADILDTGAGVADLQV
jgi:flagellar hook-length control protein FliK